MESGGEEMQRPSFLGRGGSTRKSECSVEDSRRRSRNLGEKRRRDQFNALVRQLAALVGPGPRKMDKSSVLRATIAFLRHVRDSAACSREHEAPTSLKPSFVSNRQLVSLVLDAADAALLVVCPRGRVLFSSDAAAASLVSVPPTQQPEVAGCTLFELVSESDHAALQQMLAQAHGSGVACRLRVRLRGRPPWEHVEFRGRRTNRGLLRLSARPLRPLPVVAAAPGVCKAPFSSRHSLAGHFLQLDARAARLLGYHHRELLGTSRFDLAHPDDLDALAACHRDVMLKGDAAASPLRFLCKGGRWVWLATSLYVTYHQWNAKPEFLVCTHRLVGSEVQAVDTVGSISDSSESQSQTSRVTLTRAQSVAQAALVRRHARLQRLITAQQEELRQVSRQLHRANQQPQQLQDSSPVVEN